MTGEKLYKKIKQGDEAILKLKQGVDLVADIIKTTLGPKGRNVIIKDVPYEKPRSKNDGHYIAQAIEHDDPTVNAGCEMMREVCSKTNDRVGDGTTSTAVITQAIISNGFEEIKNGRNPVDVKNEINEDLKIALEQLKKVAKPLKTYDDIENIATISGNNDKAIGRAIRQIKEQLGMEAPIITEKHDESDIKTNVVKGIYFKEGYGKKKAFISNLEKATAEIDGDDDDPVYILCYDGELNDINELQIFLSKLMKKYQEEKRSPANFKILIISKIAEVSSLPVNILADNNKAKLNNKVNENGQLLGFRCAAIESPRCVGYQPDVLEDIALATGGKAIGEKSARKLRDADFEVLGKAKRVVITMDSTTIIGGAGDQQLVSKHIEILKQEKEKATTKEAKEALTNRINILGSGIGIIKAGGITNMEAKERELRLEDAILATKAAIEEGIVTGGGNTFYDLANYVKSNVMKESLKSIVRQVAKNAGRELDEVKVLGDTGYNALTDKYENLSEAGVIDAAKVIRVVLENAVSFASLMLTTSSSVVIYEKDKSSRK